MVGRDVSVESSLAHQRDGIQCAAVAAGIKSEGVLDFTVVKLTEPGAAAAVFTRRLCPSYAVHHDREVLADRPAHVLSGLSKKPHVVTPTEGQCTQKRARWIAKEV